MTTKTEEEDKYAETTEWLDSLDPATTLATDASDLRHIAEALDAVVTAEDAVVDAVRQARANGRSWGHIGIALNTTRQNAYQRFSNRM